MARRDLCFTPTETGKPPRRNRFSGAGAPRRAASAAGLRPCLENQVAGSLAPPPEPAEPADPTTSRMRPSPACAPRAAPASCDIDAGTQSIVDAE
jgi:hypothetical protein